MRKTGKQRILEAFREMCIEMPADQIRIIDLVDRAGLTRTTFYRHFRNMDHVAAEFLHHMAEPAVQRAGISPADRLTELLTVLNNNTFFLSKLHDSRFWKLEIHVLRRDCELIIQRMAENINGTPEEGMAAVVSAVFSYTLFGIFQQWGIGGYPKLPESEIAALADAIAKMAALSLQAEIDEAKKAFFSDKINYHNKRVEQYLSEYYPGRQPDEEPPEAAGET